MIRTWINALYIHFHRFLAVNQNFWDTRNAHTTLYAPLQWYIPHKPACCSGKFKALARRRGREKTVTLFFPPVWLLLQFSPFLSLSSSSAIDSGALSLCYSVAPVSWVAGGGVVVKMFEPRRKGCTKVWLCYGCRAVTKYNLSLGLFWGVLVSSYYFVLVILAVFVG